MVAAARCEQHAAAFTAVVGAGIKEAYRAAVVINPAPVARVDLVQVVCTFEGGGSACWAQAKAKLSSGFHRLRASATAADSHNGKSTSFP